MPISDYHRLIFIHIPKNAGTALEQSLMTRESGHNHWQTYQQKYTEEWNNYTSFAVLRDPISRFVSCYNYARMEKSHWHSSDPGTKSIYGKHPDFETCKCYTINEMVALIFRGEATLEHPGWRPQHPWINNNGRIAVDYLVDFARLGAAMKLLSPDIDIRRVNASSSDSESILEEESILMLREIYKEDYSLTKLLGESEGGLIPEASSLTIHGEAAKSKIFRLSELPIFCISLEGATARRNTVIQMNQALRLGIRIIDAVDGRNVTRDQIQTHTKIPIKWNSLNGDRDEISTPTAAACSISHIRLWKMIVKESIEQAIIIEDDATCERDHQLKIPNDAEFVYLSTRANRNPKGEVVGPLCGSEAYYLTNGCAKKLLAIYSEIRMPVDIQWLPQIESLINSKHFICRFTDSNLPTFKAYSIRGAFRPNHHHFSSQIRHDMIEDRPGSK